MIISEAETKLLEMLKRHDFPTFSHSVRVSILLKNFGEHLHLDDSEIDKLEKVGLLHDIGKISISPSILNKGTKLTREEWEKIKIHPIQGFDILENISNDLEFQRAILQHHENYDGTGYPYGEQKGEISRFGRMLRIVDSFDAMTYARTYGKNKSYLEAYRDIEVNAGVLYDPTLSVSFITMMKNRTLTKRTKIL